jgi:hypothetical protein
LEKYFDLLSLYRRDNSLLVSRGYSYCMVRCPEFYEAILQSGTYNEPSAAFAAVQNAQYKQGGNAARSLKV